MVPEISNAKRVLLINNTSTTNGATAAGFVDVSGYDYCSISVTLPTSDAVTDKPATLRILETDATQPTASTNYATITGAVSGTDYTIPAAITSATSITLPFAVFNIDTRPRKRYIRLEVSPTTTQIITAEAILTRAEQTPVPTVANATVVINV